MFEICALLRQPKAKKARKASGPKIGVGVAVNVYGYDGVVVGKHAEHAGWWNVEVDGKVSGFDRSAIVVKG